ncbi:MAG: histidine phosphatase family protein, partial [Dehalococcoidia bacterium]
MRLLLVRHGQSEGNASGIVQGHLDFDLTDIGRMQAEATAERLRGEKVDRIIASPLKRAFSTAVVIAAPHALEVEPVPDLMEYDLGAVSGLTGAQIRERYPEIGQAYARGVRPVFPGEEGRDVFAARVREVLDDWAESRKTVVAVAHGGVITAVCYAVAGIDPKRPGLFEIANCAITEVVLDRAGRGGG